MINVVVFYTEMLIYLDGESVSLVSVSSDEEECFEKAYCAIEEAEDLGHEVLIEEARYGIL